VRYFDPTPSAAPSPLLPWQLRVEAEPHLGLDFAVRVAERELTFDTEHRWLADPAAIVAAAIGARAGSAVAAGPEWLATVRVERFELDLSGSPQARIRLSLQSQRKLRTHAVDVAVAVADRSPAAFASGMAEALAKAAAAVGAALRVD
jgi:hypothetical protein